MEFGRADSFNSRAKLKIRDKEYSYFNLKTAANKIGFELSLLPNSMKVLFENLLRFEDGKSVKKADIFAISTWLKDKKSDQEIAFHPARVLMQDFTGVPAIVDLATMRDATAALGGDPKKINPLIPVHLVIDHSVQVDRYANNKAFKYNVELEMERNRERYEFLKWGQDVFDNFKVVPPGTGICHQVNLEFLSQVVWKGKSGNESYIYPDTLVGTDSHTTMVNGLSVLGWGVGGIEAEAAMLGQPLSMLIPEVIGFKFTGRLTEGTTATDLVLAVTQMLRQKGVVNKFVEFYGEGLSNLTLADRATIANMAPEYGATCGFFPIDDETLKYMQLSGRDSEAIDLVKTYAQEQGLWRDDNANMVFTDTLELNLSEISPSLAGPKRPQDRVLLSNVAENFANALPLINKDSSNENKTFAVANQNYALKNGDVVIAAITSCTNTSNPAVMVGAGLLARNALKLGLAAKPWVKTSLAPGSKVVSEYLEKSGLQADLDQMGFNLVGYGCTTCIGNSGPLNDEIEETVSGNNLVVASVLSGNRNFEGRIHPSVRANYLASPPLCVAYALAGTVNIDLNKDPIGTDSDGKEVYLRDIWPSNTDIASVVSNVITPAMFTAKYADVYEGDTEWKELSVATGMNYAWQGKSTYIKQAPYFDGMKASPNGSSNISNARILAIFGDSITTDHISPAGSIAAGSPAAKYLNDHGIERKDFNSYGARRGNHEVMMRGTFANTRIKNEMLGGLEGGLTKYKGLGEPISIFDAAMRYNQENIATVVIAGKEYGTGSSRDWAAKGPSLQGVRAVIAESFERIHRSNLVGMGIIPLMFPKNMTRADLDLDGTEEITITGLDKITPLKPIKVQVIKNGAIKKEFEAICRVDTEVEVEYVEHGGILHYVLRKLAV